MPSASTRLEIVQRAVSMAGRGPELNAMGKQLLNDLLRGRALKVRYKQLRRTEPLTLVMGQDYVALPTLASGMIEKFLLGPEKQEIAEMDTDDYKPSVTGAQNARPSHFTVDQDARTIRFNTTPDQNYSVELTHYFIPAAYALDDTDDNTKIWYSDDEVIIEGLMSKLYSFLKDEREFLQEQRWLRLDGEYRRGIAPIQAGSSRIRLSSKFARR